jgi:hypothetical protein
MMQKTIPYVLGVALVVVSIMLFRECNSPTPTQNFTPPTLSASPSDKAVQDFVDAFKKASPGGEQSLINYANAYDNSIRNKGIQAEQKLNITADTMHYKRCKLYCDNYIDDRCFNAACIQTLEKSIYFPVWQLTSNIDSIQRHAGSTYPDLELFGYRVYFAKYPDNYRVSENLNSKYTAIVRFTYDGSDIPFPSGSPPLYSPAMNLGDLCPPQCLGTSKLPGPYGFFAEK